MAAWLALVLGLIPAADWADAATLTGHLRTIERQSGVPLYWIGGSLRMALLGTTVSEPLGDLLVVLGRQHTLTKLADVALEAV